MRRLSTFILAGALAGSTAACAKDDPTRPTETDPAFAAAASNPTPTTLTLEKIGGFDGGGAMAAEITAFDAVSRRLFVVNGALGTVDVLDLRDPELPVRVGTIAVTSLGAAANSVAAQGGIVAVAVEAFTKTDPGTIAFYRAATLQPISNVRVGALPDMVAFTPDGRYVVSANEGEPNDDYTIDPEGSVSIVDITNINRPVVRTAGFGAWNGRADELRAAGVRIFGPNASVAQDLEPEYVAIGDDGRTAYVTLQENNALAIVDIPSASVRRIVPLGYKDHRLPGNGLDASDRDGGVNIRNWPVFGMYQPDAIAAYSTGGRTYLVTANEGDAREYLGPPGFTEEARVNSLLLEPSIFTDVVCGGPCAANARLGRLTVTRTLGRNPETNRYDALYAFGARSFSIWTEDGDMVWDSGDDLEQRTANLPMVAFNASHGNNTLDDRSDNKGPEPEGVAIGRLGAKTFAFIGLERVGGVMVYDITNPRNATYVTYLNTRDGVTGDRGPEGVAFIPAVQAPGKEPLLIVGNEVSGTTAIYRIRLH